MIRSTLPLILILTRGFALSVQAEESQARAKITFDLSTISEEGLIGKGSGVRSLAYEFCIPASPKAVAEVRSIDPSLKIYHPSPGRVGCRRNQYLCIGETHQERWREKLLQLADLDYITEIQPSYAE